VAESARLELTDEYRGHLVELCRGAWALARETHIKQAELPYPAAEAIEPRPTVYVQPALMAEPLATHYRRRAEGYRFVRDVLHEALGADALAGMQRQTAAGPVGQPLADELAALESLFLGAAGAVERQLGIPPADGEEEHVERFLAWAADLGADADLAQDSRMMVPVFFDQQRRLTKVWAVLGWSARPVEVAFARAPSVDIRGADGRALAEGEGPIVEFYSSWRTLVYPVAAEVYVDRILDRDEFRRHCDAYKTRGAILANLE
jgi:hypothetical protein